MPNLDTQLAFEVLHHLSGREGRVCFCEDVMHCGQSMETKDRREPRGSFSLLPCRESCSSCPLPSTLSSGTSSIL